MRLGAEECRLTPDRKSPTSMMWMLSVNVIAIVGTATLLRSAVRYGPQDRGRSIDGTLVEVVEVDDHCGLLAVSFIQNSPQHRAMAIRCLQALEAAIRYSKTGEKETLFS